MGEPEDGQIAVAHVILNRVEKSGRSVKDVVIKPWQFSWLNQGRPPIKDYEALIACFRSGMKCLEERLDGKDLFGADHYFNPALANPKWQHSMKEIATIGGHKFFKS